MKICIPVNENKGVDSTVCEHFGSAPYFIIVDTDTLECKEIRNSNQHHSHGMCQPLSVISGHDFEGIVVGGIGTGALNKLQSAGIKVYKTGSSTIKDTITDYKNGTLQEVTPQTACGHHGHNHNCGK